MVARNQANLDALAAETGATAHPTDLASPEAVAGLISRLENCGGPADVLINNAAVGGVAEFVKMAHEDVVAHAVTNYLAPMLLCRQALPGMLTRGRGSVVFVSSLAAEAAMPNAAAYTSSKAALTLFGQNLRRELARTPVTALVVLLGVVDTPMLAGTQADPVMAEVAKKFEKLKPLDPAFVATEIAEGLLRDRAQLVLPRVAAPMVGLRNLPRRLMDLSMRRVGV